MYSEVDRTDAIRTIIHPGQKTVARRDRGRLVVLGRAGGCQSLGTRAQARDLFDPYDKPQGIALSTPGRGRGVGDLAGAGGRILTFYGGCDKL
jgi:hypothetical protein